LDQVTFDDEHSSALDGTIVWKSLAERDKVFDNGQFTARALVHNLRETDYGKTLSDIRAAFYSAPRLPLLYNGDRDLQQAIYDAVSGDLVAIVDGAGVSVAVTAAAQVNLSSTGLRLAKPQPAEPVPSQGAGGGGTETTGGHEQPPGGGGVNDTPGSPGAPAPPTPAATERQINFSFTQNLLANQSSADDLANAFKTLYTALDERNISYLQATLQMVGDATTVDALKALLDQIGIQANVKDM
jgi:hypothetical protein